VDGLSKIAKCLENVTVLPSCFAFTKNYKYIRPLFNKLAPAFGARSSAAGTMAAE
jgi:hypothetical protein